MAKGKKTGGRRPGSQNKVTKTARESYEHVFLAIGSVEGMATWAIDNRSEFYRQYARLIPVAVAGADGKGPVATTVTNVFETIVKADAGDR